MRYWAQPKFIDAGGAVLVSPEAGEAFYLTQREKLRLAEIALEELGDKTIVFSGVMQTTTKACIEEAQALKRAGVHGLFLMPPIGTIDIVAAWDSAKNPEVWIDQLREIADAVNLPVIIHPTGGKFFALPLESGMKTVDAVPQIVGYKMITEDFDDDGACVARVHEASRRDPAGRRGEHASRDSERLVRRHRQRLVELRDGEDRRRDRRGARREERREGRRSLGRRLARAAPHRHELGEGLSPAQRLQALHVDARLDSRIRSCARRSGACRSSRSSSCATP